MDCCTTATRRNKTFAVLHALSALQPLPTVLLQVISEYTVVPFLAGQRAETLWIRELDDEQQPWRVGFSHLVLPDWPVAMAVANNRHLLVLQPHEDDSPFDVANHLVALPLDSELPNRTEWREIRDHCQWRLLVLSCGTPIVLHFVWENWANRKAFLCFGLHHIAIVDFFGVATSCNGPTCKRLVQQRPFVLCTCG